MKDFIMSIDLGGTRVKIGIFDKTQLLDFAIYPSFRDKKTTENMEMVRGHCFELCKNANISIESVRQIGLAFPGLVNCDKGHVISSSGKFEDAGDFNFKEWAEDNFNAAIYMDNDSRLACWGEKQAGAGKSYSNIVMVTFGTGIGTGVVIEDQLLIGKHYQAGCLGGHIPVVANGRKCHCGNIGCVEAEASLPALNEKAENHPEYRGSELTNFDFRELFEAYQNNDDLAIEIAEYGMSLWSTSLVSYIHAYDPEAIILGGGIMKSKHIIIPYFKNYIEKHAWTPRHKVKIINAILGDKAGVYGAYLKAKQLIA